MKSNQSIKALCLFSGGLDSQLAVCLIREQGIKVECITFQTPFYSSDTALIAADQLRVPIHLVDFTNTIVGLIEKPQYGFGSAINPCIDCHANMLKVAGEFLKTHNFSFLVTGDVFRQRAFSQNTRSFKAAEEISNCPGLIVRPLSGGLLPETIPEMRGWIERDKLKKISGRSRAPQKQLAKKFGLKDYPQPAGGCRLTETGFSVKIKDLIAHNELKNRTYLESLKIGRHFRIGNSKLVLGRNHQQNQDLAHLAGNDNWFIEHLSPTGPSGLLSKSVSANEFELACQICAFYGNTPENGIATLSLK
ncbi:MAG: tRNA 4-thiouridine(8) synthase ThiI [Lentisphaerae bacterium]|nr:tRNA 4-thiouridine(8) synthase ThiI [Lentisphaerota bacterium]